MNNLIIVTAFFCCFSFVSYSQDKAAIKRAALDYIEGFYEGDTMKIKRSLHPDLSKYGYRIDKKTKEYIGRQMTYERALNFARDVAKDPRWAAPEGAVKKVKILDVQDKIASVKLTAYWGIDYVLLAKLDGRWMIKKVLWQSVKK